MKITISKDISKISSKIQELISERLDMMVKQSDKALEALMKEHGTDEVRVVKSPFEDELIDFECVPGIRFKKDGKTFRFTRFAMVNKVVHAKGQEVLESEEEDLFAPEEPEWTPLYLLKRMKDLTPNLFISTKWCNFLPTAIMLGKIFSLMSLWH